MMKIISRLVGALALAFATISVPVMAQSDAPSGVETVRIIQNGSTKAVTLNSLMSNLLPSAMDRGGIAAMAPDPSGDSGPAINARLQQMALNGCGTLTLGRGLYETSVPIELPTKCGLAGAGKEATILRKSATFPDGGTLLNMAGTPGNVFGDSHRTGMVLSNLQLNGAAKPGLLVDMSYTSVSTITAVRLSGCPGTALLLREAWDHTIMDLQANNCGGPDGDSDAVIRILGSATDKSNLLRFFGVRLETFRNTGISINDDGFGANSSPYGITFNSLKLESSILVNNATLFHSSLFSGMVALRDVYLQFTAPSARTGIRGIDIDGNGQIVDGVQANIGANVAVTSLVRIPRGGNGGLVRELRATGSTNLTSMVEADAVRADNNNVVYNERAMRIEGIKPFGAVPLVGGAGVDSAGYQFTQLDGSVSRTITANSTVRRSDVNRVLAANHTNTTTPIVATIPPEGDRFGAVGDVITISQEGAGAVTLTGFVGSTTVVVQVPSGLSATTSGQYTQVRARKIATNLWRVF